MSLRKGTKFHVFHVYNAIQSGSLAVLSFTAADIRPGVGCWNHRLHDEGRNLHYVRKPFEQYYATVQR